VSGRCRFRSRQYGPPVADAEPRWWSVNGQPRTSLQVTLAAVLLFAVCAGASWGLTRDWTRALSYATGFVAVWLVIAAVRALRHRSGRR
jgi:hypothetical protein